MSTPNLVSAEYRAVTLEEAARARSIPFLRPIGGRGSDAPPLWIDLGDVDLDEQQAAHLAQAIDARDWRPGSTVTITRPRWRSDYGLDDVDLRGGMVLEVREPGMDPREVTLGPGAGPGGSGAYVHMTHAEVSEHQRQAWEARLAAMDPRERTYYALMARAHTRAATRDAEQEADQDLRAAIRDALTAGHPVAEVARWTGLSVQRIYQIRDGKR